MVAGPTGPRADTDSPMGLCEGPRQLSDEKPPPFLDILYLAWEFGRWTHPIPSMHKVGRFKASTKFITKLKH